MGLRDWYRARRGKSSTPDEEVAKLQIDGDDPDAMGDKGSIEATKKHIESKQ